VQAFVDQVFKDAIIQLKKKHEEQHHTIQQMVEKYIGELTEVLKAEWEHQRNNRGQPDVTDDIVDKLGQDQTNIWLHAVHDTLKQRKKIKRNYMRQEARQLSIQDFERMTDIAVVDLPRRPKWRHVDRYHNAGTDGHDRYYRENGHRSRRNRHGRSQGISIFVNNFSRGKSY
jgi:hypothetical protein